MSRHLSLLFDPTPIQCLEEETYFSKALEKMVIKGVWVFLQAGQERCGRQVGKNIQELVLVLWSKPRSIWFQTSLDTDGATFLYLRNQLALCHRHLSKRKAWLLFGVATKFLRIWEDGKANGLLASFAICIIGVCNIFDSFSECREL